MRRSILIAGILALTLTGAALAQGSPVTQTRSGAATMNSMQTVTGTVVSTDDNQVVVKTDDGTQMTFTRDSMSGKFPSEVQNGSRVTIQYDTPQPGTYHVDTVSLGTTPGGTSTKSNMNMDGSTTTATTTTTRANRPMPRTASPVPLIGLAGLLALGAGLGLRAVRKH